MRIITGSARRSTPLVLDSDAFAIISAMTVTPGPTRQSTINTLVLALKAASVWTSLGVLYIHAAHAEQASLLNWKAPSGTPALATNSPTFTTDRGWSSDGVAAYIDTQTALDTIPNYTQDNAHIGGYFAFGSTNSIVAGQASVSNALLQRSAATLQSRLNSSSSNNSGNAISATAGQHLLVSRAAAANYQTYVQGVAGSDVVAASIAPGAGIVTILRNTVSYPSPAMSARAYHAGSSLTAGNVTSIYNAIQAYMTTVGAS